MGVRSSWSVYTASTSKERILLQWEDILFQGWRGTSHAEIFPVTAS